MKILLRSHRREKKRVDSTRAEKMVSKVLKALNAKLQRWVSKVRAESLECRSFRVGASVGFHNQ